jgi:hypothetical protein
MNRNWNDIKWIFETDGYGSLRDMYVQEVSLSDWERLIDILNSKYSAGIDKDYAIQYLADESGEMEARSATIELTGLSLNCHFFLPDQIEFDIDPKEVKSIEAYHYIEGFMEVISKVLDNQVTLTGESSPEYPLVKIDYNKGVNSVLTEQEVNDYFWCKANSISYRLMGLKNRIEMKLFPKRFRDKASRSGKRIYTSTKKDKNVW